MAQDLSALISELQGELETTQSGVRLLCENILESTGVKDSLIFNYQMACKLVIIEALRIWLPEIKKDPAKARVSITEAILHETYQLKYPHYLKDKDRNYYLSYLVDLRNRLDALF